MRTRLLAPVITVLLVALALLLNPSADRHRAAIKQAVAERNQLAGVLGVGVLAAFVSNYTSYGVVSYTEVNGRVLSIGAFGYVHVRALAN